MNASSASTTGNLTIELWPIERPIPYVRNARVCRDKAVSDGALD